MVARKRVDRWEASPGAIGPAEGAKSEGLKYAVPYLWGRPPEGELTDEAVEINSTLAAVSQMSNAELIEGLTETGADLALMDPYPIQQAGDAATAQQQPRSQAPSFEQLANK
jgi:hypothetical protein